MTLCRQLRFFHVSSFEPAIRNLVPLRHINRQYSGRSVDLQSELARQKSKIQMPSLRRVFLQVLLMLVSIVWISSALPCWGQAVTGSIVGTVTDSTGAIVPQVAITATNESTGVISSTTADSSGRYGFLSLPAGTYTISAGQTGFATTNIAGIPLRLYQQLTQNIVLKVGKAKQTVTVEGTPTLVDTTDASLGTTVNRAAILDLPLDLREVSALALLVPGTVDTGYEGPLTSGEANGSGFNDISYSGSGGGSGGNILLIDGMMSRALNNSSFALSPPPEFVHEFKIQNNVYDASFGGASGTVMNLITESGTNTIHGSGWEYARNSVMDAIDYFALTKASLSRNQFGGAIGGPIVKDKIFYFGAYEGLRLTQGEVALSVVPTTAERTGNFSSFLTGTTANLCASSGSAAPTNLNFDTGQLFYPNSEQNYTCPNSGQTVLVGMPIPGNIITTLDPVAQKVLALYPTPNTTGVFNYTNETPSQRQNDQFDGRVDATPSRNDTTFVRYLLGNANMFTPGPLPTFSTYQHFRGQNIVGGWTRTMSSSAINDVRIGYQHNYLSYGCAGCPRPPGTLASFGIVNLTPPAPQFDLYPNIFFQNFATWGDNGYSPTILPDTVEQYEDTFTKVIGRHTISLGTNWDFWQLSGLTSPPQVNGQLSFNGQYSSLAGEIPGVSAVSDLADLELGYPSGGTYTKNAIFVNLFGGRWISAFAQDSIRVSPRFTLQAGLRWEYRRQPMEKDNHLTAFFPLSKTSTPGDALMLTALPDAANDALCSNPLFLSASGQCLVMSSGMRREEGFTGNKIRQISYGPGPGYFAPRVGLSWQPTDSDRFILHAGAGMFANLPNTNERGPTANADPVVVQNPIYVTSFGNPPPLTNGVPTTTQQMFANATTAPLSAQLGIFMPSPFYKTPETFAWSVSIQSQLAKEWGTEIAYVGNKGTHLDYIHVFGNQATPGVGDLQPRRPYPDFNSLIYSDYQSTSNYNALQAKLEKRASNGFAALISYTYSRTLDNDGGDEDFDYPQNDNDPNADYGLADFGIGQTLVVSPIYQLPFGKGQRFLGTGHYTNLLVGGWEVSAIITAHSGTPFTVNSTQDYSNTNSVSPRPDRVCNGTGPKKQSEWFNLNCFTTTALAQALANGTPRFGTAKRNILIAPGVQNWDIEFIKRTNIGSRVTTEFRGEFFNAFNHVNFGAPGATIGSGTAGIISSDAGPRDIQLGVKVEF